MGDAISFIVRIAPVCCATVAATASLLLATHSTAAGSDLAGRWSGVVQQADGQTYLAVMEFDAAGRGRSDYPSLDCSGKLTGTGLKGVYEFRETISADGRATEAGRCIDGTIQITVSGNVMKWSWSGKWRGKLITAAGTLAREGGGS
jgi:hypothetical protein